MIFIFAIVITLITIQFITFTKNDNRFFIKFLSVVLITLSGGTITCGGNIFIATNSNINDLIQLWIIEIICIFIASIFFLNKNINLKSPKFITFGLIDTLVHIDISNIDSVSFILTDGTTYDSTSDMMKSFAVYITTSLNKSSFEGDEVKILLNKPVGNKDVKNINNDSNIIEMHNSDFIIIDKFKDNPKTIVIHKISGSN